MADICDIVQVICIYRLSSSLLLPHGLGKYLIPVLWVRKLKYRKFKELTDCKKYTNMAPYALQFMFIAPIE